MSDLPQQNTIVQYVGDGINDEYIVPFYTPVDSDGTPNLDVYTQASDAEPIPESDLKVWNVDYIYTPNLDPITGGVVTFLPGKIPGIGYIVTIVRDVQASLDVEFSNAQTFSGITLDAALDKLLLISQQNKSYTLDRNLSYIVNSYIPDSSLSANVQIPVLGNGQVWFGSADGVIAATLEQPADVSTLRSELANESPVTNGAALVGYYDEVNLSPTTVADQLTYLTSAVVAPFPTGVIVDFAGTSSPAGFLLCDGSAVSRATYDELFAVIGVTWGAGNGSTTFNLPDFRRRVAMGSGGTGTSTIGNAVGNTGGSENVTLGSTNMPSGVPTNTLGSGSGTIINGQPGANLNVPGSAVGYAQGSAVPVNNIQPSAIVMKIIKT